LRFIGKITKCCIGFKLPKTRAVRNACTKSVWIDGKAEVGRVTEEKRGRKKIGRERVRRKKMQVREKVEKSQNTVCFPMFCGSGGSKSRLAKAAGAEPSREMRDKKLHAVVARSRFGSQNADI